MTSAFLDTNVLVYAFGVDDVRTLHARAILGRGGIVSVQVLNEFVSVTRRKLKMSWSDIEHGLNQIAEFCGSPRSLTLETHREALQISRDHGLYIYDANIVAAAQLAGCGTLYTEDLQDGRRFGPLTIRNPFAR